MDATDRIHARTRPGPYHELCGRVRAWLTPQPQQKLRSRLTPQLCPCPRLDPLPNRLNSQWKLLLRRQRAHSHPSPNPNINPSPCPNVTFAPPPVCKRKRKRKCKHKCKRAHGPRVWARVRAPDADQSKGFFRVCCCCCCCCNFSIQSKHVCTYGSVNKQTYK